MDLGRNRDANKENMPDKKIMLLIDGDSVMHRMYHGTPDLKSYCGTPTNAIYCTLRIISNLVAGRKPTHLVIALDGIDRTGCFRKKIYPAYKSNRKPKDPGVTDKIESTDFNK